MYLKLTHLLAVLAAVPAVFSSPIVENSICAGQSTISESFIGKDKNVKVQYISCAAGPPDTFQARSVKPRQTNVCGKTCNTNCFTPSGGGPDPNECHVIADALRYESQNTGALFQIGTGTNNTITMTYRSCLSFFVNQDFGPEVYCRTDFADVIDWVAPHCQSAQNAHGGNCVASDQTWYIQVQNSTAPH
ncbi:hypothetical protein BDN72DRAFT_838395 [Pluteus cervinus]|uniref:Uncharacterized protein n=1 Tax=Pluteus cervinus TaxID=181527 RepID=A0ACD3AZX6_9AGAR|nr:hypothetical protein BDN72DRAFT_838395 [Pluteus cervinus]